jgi:hypothetical protein
MASLFSPVVPLLCGEQIGYETRTSFLIAFGYLFHEWQPRAVIVCMF